MMTDLRETEVSAAIGDVLNPCLLTVGGGANNTGFGLYRRIVLCARSDCSAERRNVSWGRGKLVDKARKTGRKRDVILTDHFRQRAGVLCPGRRTGTAGTAVPWLA